MRLTEVFDRSLKTLRETPGLFLYSFIIMVVFLFMSLPMIIQQGGFFATENGVGLYHIFNLIEPFVLPESPPAGIPLLAEGAVNPGATASTEADAGILQALFAMVLSIFLVPAYLGIAREAILYQKKPQIVTFFRYGMHYFFRILVIILILLGITFFVALLVGLVGMVLLPTMGEEGVATINISLTIIMWIVFFYFLFVEMELLERGREEKLSIVITSAMNLSGANKFKLISCLVGFLGIGVLTSLIMIAVDILPLVLSALIVPVINTIALTFILLGLYHFYYEISGRYQYEE